MKKGNKWLDKKIPKPKSGDYCFGYQKVLKPEVLETNSFGNQALEAECLIEQSSPIHASAF